MNGVGHGASRVFPANHGTCLALGTPTYCPPLPASHRCTWTASSSPPLPAAPPATATPATTLLEGAHYFLLGLCWVQSRKTTILQQQRSKVHRSKVFPRSRVRLLRCPVADKQDNISIPVLNFSKSTRQPEITCPGALRGAGVRQGPPRVCLAPPGRRWAHSPSGTSHRTVSTAVGARNPSTAHMETKTLCFGT